MKRTSVVLDDQLVEEVKSLTGIKTTREVVEHALHELLRHSRQKDILKLRGRIDWQGDLDAMRGGREF